jgi:hypothetical protein
MRAEFRMMEKERERSSKLLLKSKKKINWN